LVAFVLLYRYGSTIDLHSNLLSGSVPTNVVAIPNLRYLHLEYNCLVADPAALVLLMAHPPPDGYGGIARFGRFSRTGGRSNWWMRMHGHCWLQGHQRVGPAGPVPAASAVRDGGCAARRTRGSVHRDQR
jgi:hypothetical protein